MFLKFAGRSTEATIYFYNYPDSQLVYMLEPSSGEQIEDDVVCVNFNPTSMIGKCVNKREITIRES